MCTVHLVVDDSEDYENLTDNINLITAVTRVDNIEILPASDYEPRQGSLMCDIIGLKCRVFLILLNGSDVELVRERLEKKRIQTEKKLDSLFKTTSRPKYASKPEGERLRDRENVRATKIK